MYPDLLFHYGVDLVETVEGRGHSPSVVILCIKRLPDTSLTHAKHIGGMEHFGWGQDRHLHADLYDALNENTRACGNFKGKPPKVPKYPRPKRPEEQEAKPKSVADLYQKFIGG